MSTATRETVTVEIDKSVHDMLMNVVVPAKKARRKYAPTKLKDALEECIYEAKWAEQERERRKKNARRRRLNYRKWWVGAKAYERLAAITKRVEAEAEPGAWGGLNRIEQNTHVLTLLLDDYEQADAQRHVPIGAHIGGRPGTCPTCFAKVAEVWLDGEPVRDEDGRLRIIALTGSEQFVKAALTLTRWTPESGLARGAKPIEAKIMKGRDSDELPPFFSEAFTYELFSKDDARTLRALVRDVLTAGGMSDDKAYEVL